MESDLTSMILERFNLFESILLLTLWKCFHEIRTLYYGHIKEKEYAFRELKKEMQECNLALAELKTHCGQPNGSSPFIAPPRGRNPKIP